MEWSKPKIKFIQAILPIFIAVLFINSPFNTLTAQAGWDASYVGMKADVAGNSGASGASSGVTNGVKYTRTGYLCYMLTVDGQSVPGTKSVALQSPGYAGIATNNWRVKDRKGYYGSVSSWSGSARDYWNCTPWANGGTSNFQEIKSWMATTNELNEPHGYTFVKNVFGPDAAKGFSEDKYVLVLETIMNFQYSIVDSSGGSSLSEAAQAELAKWTPENSARYVMRGMTNEDLIKDAKEHNPSLWREYNRSTGQARKDIVNQMRKELEQQLIEHFSKQSSSSGGGNYKLVGEPVTGTVPELIKYKRELGYEKSYLDLYVNGVAPLAEMIEQGSLGERAGFTAYTGPSGDGVKLSNDTILSTGTAMAVFSAHDMPSGTGTHTWDSDHQPAGGGNEEKAPEPPSTALPTEKKFTIIKSYRQRDKSTNTLTDKGTFVRDSTVASILIEDEPLNSTDKNYKVIGWKHSTTPKPSSLNALNWESSVPSLVGETGDGSGSTTLPDTHRYLYVLLEAEKDTVPLTVNFTVTIFAAWDA